MARVRSNRVCFTLNNYEESVYEEIEGWYSQHQEEVTYFVVGEEVGKEGTPHLQGFVHIKKPRKDCGIKFWKNYLPWGRRCHFANAHGSDEDNQKYCSKEGPFLQYGTPTGISNRFQEIFEAAKEDVAKAIAIDYEFGMRHYHALKSIFEDHNKPSMQQELVELRDWQRTAITKLENQSDRQILFIVDPEGGKGKTVLCKHLLSTKKAWACQGN